MQEIINEIELYIVLATAKWIGENLSIIKNILRLSKYIKIKKIIYNKIFNLFSYTFQIRVKTIDFCPFSSGNLTNIKIIENNKAKEFTNIPLYIDKYK